MQDCLSVCVVYALEKVSMSMFRIYCELSCSPLCCVRGYAEENFESHGCCQRTECSNKFAPVALLEETGKDELHNS